MKFVTIRQPQAAIQSKRIEPVAIGTVNVQENCIIIEVAYDHRAEKLPMGRCKLITPELPELQCN